MNRKRSIKGKMRKLIKRALKSRFHKKQKRKKIKRLKFMTKQNKRKIKLKDNKNKL